MKKKNNPTTRAIFWKQKGENQVFYFIWPDVAFSNKKMDEHNNNDNNNTDNNNDDNDDDDDNNNNDNNDNDNIILVGINFDLCLLCQKDTKGEKLQCPAEHTSLYDYSFLRYCIFAKLAIFQQKNAHFSRFCWV